ncbi:MAG: acetate/propionate family kinase [Rickettsiales bacterium]
MIPDVIVAVNVGSSSIKFSIFAAQKNLKLLESGSVSVREGIPEFSLDGKKAKVIKGDGLKYIAKWLQSNEHLWNVVCIGHRVVHGGSFAKPVLVTSKVIKALQRLIPLAPLHQPYNIEAIEILGQEFPRAKQIACFDTAFHTTIAPLVQSYALPKKYRAAGVRRYGFHGLSYNWIARLLKVRFKPLYNAKVVAAHLGNGSSLCAMQKGKSYDTTMGMTALDGLPMGTRSGTIDTGALIYMLRNFGLALDQFEHMLEFDSGLKGLSGVSNDLRTLLKDNSPDCQFALDYYAFKVAQGIAQMAVSLGGIDAVVFTGGIAEHNLWLTKKILKQLKFLGKLKVLTIKCNEEKMIAMECLALRK